MSREATLIIRALWRGQRMDRYQRDVLRELVRTNRHLCVALNEALHIVQDDLNQIGPDEVKTNPFMMSRQRRVNRLTRVLEKAQEKLL